MINKKTIAELLGMEMPKPKCIKEVKIRIKQAKIPRTTETQLCVDIKPRNWIRILKN